MRALVVDDSRAMRAIMRRLMTELSFEVEEAQNGKEAYAFLEQHAADIDLALVDWHMPEMDGLELVRAMQDDASMFRIRTMMVTAETDVRRVLEALRAGADEYLMKPVTKEALVEKLQILGFETASV